MEEDSRDLANIFESISPNDVPPPMQIMWEIKKTQLSAQSPRSYRWDPRYITYFTVLVFSVFSSRFFDAYVKEISYRTYKSTLFCLILRIVRLALDLYCKNPKALDTVREFIILPSNRLIR